MNDIIERIAKQNRTTKREVKKEIQKAIKTAMESNDYEAKTFWDEIAPNKKEPTIDVVIEKIAAMVSERKYG